MNNHRINSDLDATAQSIANHLASAAVLANAVVSRLLSLSDEDLAGWLNSQPPQKVMALFAAHEQLGTSLNAASATAAGVLAEWGANPPQVPVDVRPFSEKLAAQFRTVEFDGTTFSVVALPQPDTTDNV